MTMTRLGLEGELLLLVEVSGGACWLVAVARKTQLLLLLGFFSWKRSPLREREFERGWGLKNVWFKPNGLTEFLLLLVKEIAKGHEAESRYAILFLIL